ncbi:hypothetical protein ACVILE_000273 [Streptomyces sp. M18.1]
MSEHVLEGTNPPRTGGRRQAVHYRVGTGRTRSRR